jgi:hypothetical protein
MVESPVCENRRKILSPWRTAQIQNRDNIDDVNLTLNSTLGSIASESILLNANFHTNEVLEFNTLFQKMASEPFLNV